MVKTYFSKIVASVVLSLAISSVSAEDRMVLSIGAVETLSVGKVEQIAIGNDELVSVDVLEAGKVLLIPKKVGETDIVIWTTGERVKSVQVTILPMNMQRQVGVVGSILRSYKNVSLRSVQGNIILEGSVSPEELEKFETVVGTIPNALSLVKPKFSVKDVIELKVRVLEVDKRYRRELGINWQDSIDGPILGTVGALETNSVYRIFPASSDTFNDELSNLIPVDTDDVFSFAGIATSITSRIQLIQENNAGRVLAEPTLRTRSGEEASFLAGGLVPYTTVGQFGQVQVEFQEYGIQLFIQPTSDGDGNILSAIRAEISSIDNAVTVNGVPGILTRRTESTINMRAGETIALSGLLSSNDSRIFDKVPLLGDLPVIGNLFKSKEFEEQRTEMIVLVTPRIIAPTEKLNLKPDLQQHSDELDALLGGSTIFGDELID